jgi:hypothetical protein
MLDRKVVTEFLQGEFEDWSDLEIPADIYMDDLVETFCLFTEDDLGEWLSDNFKSFFEHGDPDWDWIRDRIEHYKKQ